MPGVATTRHDSLQHREGSTLADGLKGAKQTFHIVPADVRNYREQLTGMMLELQANQAILKELLNWCGVFVFTGGDVPRGRCGLVAINSYLERPFAADRISTRELERYRHSVGAIMELGHGLAAGPRTLRCRKDIGDAFSRASSEIQTLETALGSAMTKLLKELGPSSPAPEIKTTRVEKQSERNREWLE